MAGGFVILDKPSDMTSRTAGGRVARMFGIKKFGHLGTLDPMASGVLPIALGEATKMIPYLDAAGVKKCAVKEYEFSVKWGIETDTGDITGKIIKETPHSTLYTPNFEQIRRALGALAGEIEQTPPAYSAIKIGGRKAYEMARRGVDFEMPKRKVMIYDLVAVDQLPLTSFIVKCSAGTYVRTLAQQIAGEINKMGNEYICTCDMIRRTRTHMFDIKDAVGLDFLENLYNNDPQSVSQHLKPVDFGLDDILVLEIGDNEAALFRNGGFVGTDGDGQRRVYNNSEFIGIGEIVNGQLRPKRIITTQG
ncbi:MAG: tRNA pseudouridine(55) synthase TruB [Alphaproteobacteria bacterium]|nr:tRNA pseudouridine(55) synthase TruB [Alphaproteobacteria bacterium]